jgi:hypothetical protein
MTLSTRLDPATYSEDEPVGIAAVPKEELPGPLPNERWRYIPERIWNRILLLGSAYELHFAAVLEPVVDAVLDPTQCETVDEELRFLAAILNDDALKSALSVILGELVKVRGRSGMALVFSPP